MTLMPTLPEVTDPEQRAELARWAVALRRAHAAGTGQAEKKLHHRSRVLDVDGNQIGWENSFCCLGIWCAMKAEAGVLVSASGPGSGFEYGSVAYGDADDHARDEEGDHGFASGALPAPALLADSADPDLLRGVFEPSEQPDLDDEAEAAGYVDAEAFVEEEATTVSAAELNDDHGLNFAQIADVVVWRYQLTPEELAEAEKAPRVPAVEGPEPEAA